VSVARLRAVVDLVADPQAPAAGRTVTGALLSLWGLPELREDAQLIVSELVTNAVEHAPGSDPLQLEIARHGNGVRISLADSSEDQPVVVVPHDRPRGRGMLLIQALAHAWGAEPRPGGKREWVDLLQVSPA
jgi:anti-sigma regulatory factor (Ser/Thr protein kinase)